MLATAYVLIAEPEKFLILPRSRPALWAMVMLLYPVLSVLPQEIIYRLYIFEVLGKANPILWLLPSAILFGWVHIIYSGYFAVWTTSLAGIPLAWNYLQNRGQAGALWPLLFEHALYGQIIFTVGLGQYFYLAH